MKRLFLSALLLWTVTSTWAQRFEDYFEDRTLRIDYTFSGNHERQQLYVDELVTLPRWYGRRQRLAELPLKGNGQLTVRDKRSGEVIYRHSFSSLFQEWLATEEAKHTPKSFENVFLIPFPKEPVDITVELRDYHEQVTARMTHTVDPKDILIRRMGERQVTPYVTLQQAADTMRCIHVAYVAEGYQQHEMDIFLEDCKIAMESLFQHEPFRQMQNRFNMVAVMSPSVESGTSEPSKGIWKQTALDSHFDTFYSDRYLTTLHLKEDWATSIPMATAIPCILPIRNPGNPTSPRSMTSRVSGSSWCRRAEPDSSRVEATCRKVSGEALKTVGCVPTRNPNFVWSASRHLFD